MTIFELIGNLVYGVLAVLALWGAYCIITTWRRVAATRFVDEEEQEEFLDEFSQHLQEENLEQVEELCGDDRRALPQLALVAFDNREEHAELAKQRVGERFRIDVMADIEQRLSWVSTVAKSAPMVGLLGTVMGMMGAFDKIKAASGDAVKPDAMAGDIATALITTACGLAIAIPLVIAKQAVDIRIRSMQDLVGIGLAQVMDYFWPNQQGS